MGLDMYAYSVDGSALADGVEVDFDLPESVQRKDVAYWRKHPDLHGWMEDLYTKKGGKEDFNCVPVRLQLADIDQLEKDIQARGLPSTSGFFFGQSMNDEREIAEDMEFVANARSELQAGRIVYYTSWW